MAVPHLAMAGVAARPRGTTWLRRSACLKPPQPAGHLRRCGPLACLTLMLLLGLGLTCLGASTAYILAAAANGRTAAASLQRCGGAFIPMLLM